MRYFKWVNVRIFLMIGLIMFLFSFTTNRNSNRKLVKTDVIFVGSDNVFIEAEAVNKLLIEKKSVVESIKKEQVDLNTLEKSLNNHNMIEKSEVFVTVDGVLKAVITQKTPIVRVITETGSFYIDYEGNKMPLSDIQSARIPLVSAANDQVEKKEVQDLFRYIFDDEFLRKNIIGMEILPNGGVKLANRNYSYVIDFGKPQSIERKFANYKAFFQKASADSTLLQYKRVNLKFTQQVVCTK